MFWSTMIKNKIFFDWSTGISTCTLIIKKDLARLYKLDNGNINLELIDEGILIKKEKDHDDLKKDFHFKEVKNNE